MSYLKKRAQNFKSQAIEHGNCFIPQLESGDNSPLDYVSNFFRSFLISNYEIDKIIIIDPYLSTAELQRLAKLFGGDSKNKLEIITKFQTFQTDDLNKEDTINKVLLRKNELISNGLFNAIDIMHSQVSMHDRYLIFSKNGKISFIFTTGGSINQNFTDYIYLHQVSDPYFFNSIIQYYEILKNDIRAEY